MGKVVKTVAVIAAAAAIAYFAPALGAAFLKTVGVTAVAGSAAATAATAAAAVALTMAASFAMTAIAGKPQASSTSTMFRQAITNARIIYGKRRASGVIVFFHGLLAGKFHYRFFVIAVAGHRCKGVTRWYLNDEVVTVGGDGLVTTGAYANDAWLWFGRGTDQQEAPQTFLTDTNGKWTPNHIGRGVAKIYAKFRMTEAVIAAGIPNISAEIEGKDDVRDPRTGTRSYLRNAAAVFYDWMALPREDGGFGAYEDEMPADAWMAAQCAVSDEAVALAAGGSEERYALDAVIEVGAPPSEVRQTLVTCCAGTYSYSGGQHMMRVGYFVPISAELQEDDLAGAISIPLLAEEGEIATEFSGTFVDPDALYQPQPVPTRSVASVDVRQADADLPHITSHTRAQRILEIMLRRAAAEKRVNWPMNIMGLEVSAMDTVRLATDRHGLSNYAWTVSSWGLSSDYGVTIGVKEENADIYGWTMAMERPRSGAATLDPVLPIVDGRAARQILSGTQTVAYPVSSTADTVSVIAFDATIDTGARLSFPAATLGGLSAATGYVLLWSLKTTDYMLLPVAGQAAIDASSSGDNVIVRYVNTATAGGSYPADPTPPGGDGGGGYNGRPVVNQQ